MTGLPRLADVRGADRWRLAGALVPLRRRREKPKNEDDDWHTDWQAFDAWCATDTTFTAHQKDDMRRSFEWAERYEPETDPHERDPDDDDNCRWDCRACFDAELAELSEHYKGHALSRRRKAAKRMRVDLRWLVKTIERARKVEAKREKQERIAKAIKWLPGRRKPVAAMAGVGHHEVDLALTYAKRDRESARRGEPTRHEAIEEGRQELLEELTGSKRAMAFELFDRGASDDEIADALELKPSTVAVYRSRWRHPG